MFFHELQNRNSCLGCFDLSWTTYLQVWKKLLSFITFKDWLSPQSTFSNIKFYKTETEQKK